MSGYSFSQVPSAEIPRSSFDRSHGYKTTFDSGFLIPVFVDEALPGDTFKLDMTAFGRLATPIHPFMDNVYVDSFFFAVPNRLVWDNWQAFNGERTTPDASTSFTVPVITASATFGWTLGSLSDYLGIPTYIKALESSVLWHRAYNLIWNEWFRDQNLQQPRPVNKGNGPDAIADYQLLPRGKRHDYFTSALPWAQKGEEVKLPLGKRAPVISTGTHVKVMGNSGVDIRGIGFTGAGTIGYDNRAPALDGQNFKFAPDIDGVVSTGLVTDLSQATASTINELRRAFQIQKLYERDARGGTRYIEILKSHFGVTSPDARLQRPEYLGGGTTLINVNPVAQTSSTVQDSEPPDETPFKPSPQGNLAATATFSMHNHGFTKSFTEHCLLIGLISVRADLNYQQGLNRMFSRKTRWDYFWPALAHIGEQAILNKELYAAGPSSVAHITDGKDEEVFGYQERYAEYRYKPSVITGEFRSNLQGNSLDSWHLAQFFGARPTLASEFIEDKPPLSRVLAVDTAPQILFDAWFKLRCARPMPVYFVPGMMDHF